MCGERYRERERDLYFSQEKPFLVSQIRSHELRIRHVLRMFSTASLSSSFVQQWPFPTSQWLCAELEPGSVVEFVPLHEHTHLWFYLFKFHHGHTVKPSWLTMTLPKQGVGIWLVVSEGHAGFVGERKCPKGSSEVKGFR
jgi:hypothetical protein